MHFLSGGGYFNILFSFFFRYSRTIKIIVVFSQGFLHGNVPIVWLTIAVEVFKAILNVFHDNTGGQILNNFIQNLI